MVDVRLASPGELVGAASAYEEVAAERVWIGREPPIDRDALIARWSAALQSGESVMFVAVAGGEVVGAASLEWVGRCGSGLLNLGMWVISPWRGRGVGSALVHVCIDWARAHGAHKIALEVWTHNEAARALYRKFGFEEEGLFKQHWRRRSGELWDSIPMGLPL